MEWIKINDRLPEDGEILFIAKDGITTERIGIVVSEMKLILLKRTDISFDNILYWFPIPEAPKVN